MKKYPEELKRKVVAEYATSEGSRGEFLAKYAIPNTTLHQWLHAYAKPLPEEENIRQFGLLALTNSRHDLKSTYRKNRRRILIPSAVRHKFPHRTS